MTQRGITLVEVLVVMTILVTLVGLLSPAFLAAKMANDEKATVVPDGGWHLRTVKHDGHLWVIENGERPQHFAHHPDCPCRTKTAEKEPAQ